MIKIAMIASDFSEIHNELVDLGVKYDKLAERFAAKGGIYYIRESEVLGIIVYQAMINSHEIASHINVKGKMVPTHLKRLIEDSVHV